MRRHGTRGRRGDHDDYEESIECAGFYRQDSPSKLDGTFKAKVTLAEAGASVSGLKINFRSGSAAIEACAAFTDSDGIAECSPGTQFSPAFITDSVVAGYDAVFDGNAEFQPAKDHGPQTIVP
ncbi:MAG: hypothetical protein ACRDQI_12740 [Pseudonocardiaceae bacterium]